MEGNPVSPVIPGGAHHDVPIRVSPRCWSARSFVAPRGAVAPVVNDRGKFFSSDAVKKANEATRELYGNDSKDLLIETYEGVPAENVDKVKAMSREERLKFFASGPRRAEQRVERGALHPHLQGATMIYASDSKPRSVFNEAAQTKQRDKLVEDSAKNYDEGLGMQ